MCNCHENKFILEFSPFNGGEHLLCYFHGVDQKVGLYHEFLKCDIHGTESQHNQFFMAFSWNFNKDGFIVLQMFFTTSRRNNPRYILMSVI